MIVRYTDHDRKKHTDRDGTELRIRSYSRILKISHPPHPLYTDHDHNKYPFQLTAKSQTDKNDNYLFCS